jgi:hypothetical protein
MTPANIRVLPSTVLEATNPSGALLAGAFCVQPLWTEGEEFIEEGDFPGLHAGIAETFLASENAEQATIELIKEMYVIGPNEPLLSKLFHILLAQLPQTFDRTAYKRKRHLLECTLGCCGRLLSIERNERRLRTFAKLYSRYKMSGPILPKRIESLTGHSWDMVRRIYRTYGDQIQSLRLAR